MKKGQTFESPDAYVASLSGWQHDLVFALRAILGQAAEQEVIKWGHLVYLDQGPVALIRAEESRVLLGFWRGQRLQSVEPALKSGGKYEMATLHLKEGDVVKKSIVRKLIREAIALNHKLGDPTKISLSRSGK